MEKVPHHVAIVMDGNRRWAKKRNLPTKQGHIAGSNNLQPVVEAAADLGIKVLTVYGFSTENWRRSKTEVALLMRLIALYLRNNREGMVKNGVRFLTIGDVAPLPVSVRKEVEMTKKATEKGKRIDLVIAINYGARDEIRRACHSICVDFAKKKTICKHDF